MRQTNYVCLVKKCSNDLKKLGIKGEIVDKWRNECLHAMVDYSEGYPIYHGDVIDTLFDGEFDYLTGEYIINKYRFQDYLYCKDMDELFRYGFQSGYMILDLGDADSMNSMRGVILTEQCWDTRSSVVKRGDKAIANGIYFETDDNHNLVFNYNCQVDIKIVKGGRIQILNVLQR